MSYVARAGHGVKSPHQFARSDIESAHSSARSSRWVLLQPRTCYHEIFVDGGRRSWLVQPFWPVVRDSGAKIDRSSIAETLTSLSGLPIQSEEASIKGCVEDALIHTVCRAIARNG